jgi:hypothetical protein
VYNFKNFPGTPKSFEFWNFFRELLELSGISRIFQKFQEFLENFKNIFNSDNHPLIFWWNIFELMFFFGDFFLDWKGYLWIKWSYALWRQAKSIRTPQMYKPHALWDLLKQIKFISYTFYYPNSFYNISVYNSRWNFSDITSNNYPMLSVSSTQQQPEAIMLKNFLFLFVKITVIPCNIIRKAQKKTFFFLIKHYTERKTLLFHI